MIVYDVDGLNPYGREVAVLLGGRALTARDAEWLPPGTRAVLPANRTRPGRVTQLVRLLHGLALVTYAVAVRREAVVVVLTRSVVDETVLGLLGLVGHVVLVVHDPTPKTPPTPWRRRSAALLRRTARVRVAHSAALAAAVAQQPTLVVRHLPFRAWWADWSTRTGDGSRDAVLVLGQLRADKGLDRLPEALAGVDARVVICGKGPLEPALRQRIPGRVEDRSTVSFASDAEVAAALADSRVLVAPYRVASQSGSVALAATAGRWTVAYDVGAIGTLPAVVTVPDGDAPAFAAAVRSALTAAPPDVDVDAWAGDAAADWRAALAKAGGR